MSYLKKIKLLQNKSILLLNWLAVLLRIFKIQAKKDRNFRAIFVYIKNLNFPLLRAKLNVDIIPSLIVVRLVKFFILMFVILNLIIFIINFNKLSNQLGEMGFSVGKILLFCLFLSPLFSFQILPFAVFFSTFFCINWMFLANEVLSFYVLGYSFWRIVKKGLFVIIGIFLFSVLLQIIFPVFFGKYGSGKAIDISIIIKNLKPKILNKLSPDVLISFEDINKKGEMKNVYIFIKKDDNWKVFYGTRANFVKEATLRLNVQELRFFKINKIKQNYQYEYSKSADIDIDFFNQGVGSANFDKGNPKLKRVDRLISIYRKSKSIAILEEINRRFLIPIQVLAIGLFNIFNLFQMKSSRLEGFKRNAYSVVFFLSNILLLNFMLGFLVKIGLWGLCYLFYGLFLLLFVKKIKKTCI